jgi:hypothetical protein
MTAARVAAVIVTYNSAEHVGRCIKSLRGRVSHVVVVDNASADGSAAAARAFKDVEVIANVENRGFGAAANQGVIAAGAGFILLLNPDTALRTGIEPLLAALAKPGVGAAAGALVDDHDRVQAGFTVRRFPTPAALSFEALGINRLWPGNPVNRRYRCLDLDLGRARTVEQPAGAMLLFRRDLWERLGGFDQSFQPVWFEDVDFLKRMREAGYAAHYDPSVRIAHVGGHSIPTLGEGPRRRAWYGNLLRYAAKFFGFWGLRVTAASVALGCAGRGLVAAGGGYGAVIRLAVAAFFLGPARLRCGVRQAK